MAFDLVLAMGIFIKFCAVHKPSSNCKYFLIHQFEHMFWVLKRTVSLGRFF